MSKSRFAVMELLIITFFVNVSADVAISTAPSLPIASSAPAITLQTASGKAIEFMTQNGRTINDVAPLAVDLPHLVLYRDGALTDPPERTLMVEVTGIEVPPGGVTVTLQIETQHGDPDLGDGSRDRIPVWHVSQSITNTLGVTQTDVTAVFVREFSGRVRSGTETIATPTDYFRYEVAVVDANHPPADPLYRFAADYAFLMENQWTGSLPEVQEESDGAAPDELVIYYCDMFPFRAKQGRLDREDVPGYVHTELAPAMVKAFQDQANVWAMGPWYDEWASFRGERQLSVALAMPGTWFHGRAFNHSGITLLTYDDNALGFQYDRLIDEHMSSFQHELFHNLQLNISRHARSGIFEHWKFFTEGQAVLAESVGQSELEQEKQANYISRANQFLRTGSNKSYAKIDPYQATIYWRFLYEQCGGIDRDGVEHPAVGMQIIKRSLEALYAEDRTADDIIEKLPDVMDQALDGSSCPFQTYENSLNAFARAKYALRLENGRCGTADLVECGTIYCDAGDVYIDPWLEAELGYAGSQLTYDGAIPASYGTDLIEVRLDPGVQDQSLIARFQGEGSVARFNVQIWKLGRGRIKPRAVTPQPEFIPRDQDGVHTYVIPQVDTMAYNRLAFIITRLDPDETADPVGEYALLLEPAE